MRSASDIENGISKTAGFIAAPSLLMLSWSMLLGLRCKLLILDYPINRNRTDRAWEIDHSIPLILNQRNAKTLNLNKIYYKKWLKALVYTIRSETLLRNKKVLIIGRVLSCGSFVETTVLGYLRKLVKLYKSFYR